MSTVGLVLTVLMEWIRRMGWFRGGRAAPKRIICDDDFVAVETEAARGLAILLSPVVPNTIVTIPGETSETTETTITTEETQTPAPETKNARLPPGGHPPGPSHCVSRPGRRHLRNVRHAAIIHQPRSNS